MSNVRHLLESEIRRPTIPVFIDETQRRERGNIWEAIGVAVCAAIPCWIFGAAIYFWLTT
jgi:hypothetical protein